MLLVVRFLMRFWGIFYAGVDVGAAFVPVWWYIECVNMTLIGQIHKEGMKMKKRLLSLVLVLVMVMSMLPAINITAFAENWKKCYNCQTDNVLCYETCGQCDECVGEFCWDCGRCGDCVNMCEGCLSLCEECVTAF